MRSRVRRFLISFESAFWEKYRSSINPSIFQFDYLHNLSLFKEIQRSFVFIRKKTHKSSFEILDIGCGRKPYFELFKPYMKRYLGVDVDPKVADLVASAENLPLKNDSFDLVVCFQTLEHCRKPEKVIAEIYRVLQPGGFAILTTHGSWMYHPSPHDYYRWTNEGLSELFKNYTFVKVTANLKAWASIIQIINLELYGMASRHLFWKLPLYIIILVLNVLGQALSPFGPDHFTVNYVVLAKK